MLYHLLRRLPVLLPDHLHLLSARLLLLLLPLQHLPTTTPHPNLAIKALTLLLVLQDGTKLKVLRTQLQVGELHLPTGTGILLNKQQQLQLLVHIIITLLLITMTNFKIQHLNLQIGETILTSLLLHLKELVSVLFLASLNLELNLKIKWKAIVVLGGLRGVEVELREGVIEVVSMVHREKAVNLGILYQLVGSSTMIGLDQIRIGLERRVEVPEEGDRRVWVFGSFLFRFHNASSSTSSSSPA